jgi:hypothetical protein
MGEGLEPILQYRMTDLEAKAYKITLLWEQITRRELPDYLHQRIGRKGDPRKTALFKYCYKLVTETKDQIADNQYKLYVLAQVQMMKVLSNGDIHALVTPGILVGEKAWVRWQIWKKKFEKVCKDRQDVKQEQENKFHVLAALKSSHEFLLDKLGKIDPITIGEAFSDKRIIRWVNTEKISPYYILLCPDIQKILKDDFSIFNFDLDVYKSSITNDIEEAFKKL